MKKVKSKKDILSDSRINKFYPDWDSKGQHMIEVKDGYVFEDRATMAIGNISQLCYDINTHLMSVVDYNNLYQKNN